MPPKRSLADKQRYFGLLAQGMTQKNASDIVGIDYKTARAWEQGAKTASGIDIREANQQLKLPAPIKKSQLNAQARQARDDFGYWRLRYMGRRASPWQESAAWKFDEYLHSEGRDFTVLNCPPGAGKAVTLDTLLATPSGWTTMGEVKVGEYVLDDQGQPTQVVAKSEVFYDHDCYEVKADDGASVIADADHLWNVRLHGAGQYKRGNQPDYPGKTGPKVKNVGGIGTYTTEFLSRSRAKRPQLQIAKPLELESRDLPIDSYVLGVWLGDGTSSGGAINSPDFEELNDAKWIRSYFEEAGYATTDHKTANRFGVLGLERKLRHLGVLENKHIPSEYLHSSKTQRLELLQGLIDTDGYVSPTGHIEFCSTNSSLARGVQFLARSLGVKASLAESRAMLYGRDCGSKYRVCFYLEGAARLPRKAFLTRDGVRTTPRYLTVTRVESQPTQCIQVDSPSQLYLAGEGLMVTHNSTLLSDIELWLTCRNRALRGMVGSSTAPKAVRDCKKLRRVLERVTPIRAKPDDLAKGIAFDAEAVLAKDYGRFLPLTQDTWRAEQFIVAQWDDAEITEKEATWMAFGLDSDFLGTRVDIAVWDDTVTKKDLLTMEAMARIREIWDDEVETRIEPDGCLFLVGQRLGTEDLYAHCLAKVAEDDNDYWDQLEDPDNDEPIDEQFFIEPEGSQDELPKMYHHIVYPAHDELSEHHDHSKDAKQWPEGCLLEPRRLPWTFLKQVRANNKEKYDTVYQQKDAQPPDALVKRVWIDGGTDQGVEYPGCYDRDREVGVIPKISGKTYSVISVDPSGTQRWGLIWAIYSPEQERRHVIYAKGKKMKASDLIDWNFEQQCFTGLLEEWYQESKQKGSPITHVIIEKNDAQVYISQFSIFNKWKSERGIHYVPHQTNGVNKNSTELGVTAIGSHFEFGRWRLPGHGLRAIRDTSEFVNELVNYSSESKYRSDMVMAAWFIEMWISKIAKPDAAQWPKKQTPQWIRHSNGLRSVS